MRPVLLRASGGGHTLVWHQQNPASLFRDASGAPMTPTPENRALLLPRLENHIRSVVSHFGDDVYAWDVVNDVIDPAQPDGFRRSEWFNITGTEYIDRAFRVAREVAPNAKLFINDFNTTLEPKRTFLLNLVRDPSELPGAGSTLSFDGSYILRPGNGGGRRTAAVSFSLINDGPSGAFRFNFNDSSTKVRFVASHFITYDVTSTSSGNRVDFTLVGSNAKTPSCIVTGFALDGGPAGSGLDVLSVTVRTGLGEIVFSAEGPVNEGDVIVVR